MWVQLATTTGILVAQLVNYGVYPSYHTHKLPLDHQSFLHGYSQHLHQGCWACVKTCLLHLSCVLRGDLI